MTLQHEPGSAWVCMRHGITYDPCPCLTKRVTADLQPYQQYWRCFHHPSAIDNFFEHRTKCEWECETQELQWWHHGDHPEPQDLIYDHPTQDR